MDKKLSERDKKERLASLLKEKQELYSRLVKESNDLKKAEDVKVKFEKENKLLFFGHQGKGYLGRNGKWEANPIQVKFFNSLKNKEYKHFILHGSNRISKTFSTSGVICLLGMRGCFPWEDPEVVGRWFWDLHGWANPVKIRVVGQSWETHIKGTIVATIKELFPKSWGITSKKNNLGVEFFWTDPLTGSTVEIMSNKSESDMFEGSSNHIVVYDEPCNEKVRTACLRGLIDHNGLEFFAMTLLKEPWIEEKVMNMVDDNGSLSKTVYQVKGHINDNVGFGTTQEAVDQFARNLMNNSPEEYERRIEGKSEFQSGLILNIDKQVHFIDRFKIPSHYIVDVAIDIGWSKGHHVLYLAIDPQNIKYVCFEDHVLGDGEAIAESIIEKKHRYNLRIENVICDPLAKGDKTNYHSTWEKIDITLNRHEMYLEAGSKNKGDGVIAINNLLMTVNKMPALYIFRDLIVATQQIYKVRKKDGVILKVDDDQFENLYRLCLLGTQWEEKRVYYYQSNHYNRDAVTGY